MFVASVNILFTILCSQNVTLLICSFRFLHHHSHSWSISQMEAIVGVHRCFDCRFFNWTFIRYTGEQMNTYRIHSVCGSFSFYATKVSGKVNPELFRSPFVNILYFKAHCFLFFFPLRTIDVSMHFKCFLINNHSFLFTPHFWIRVDNSFWPWPISLAHHLWYSFWQLQKSSPSVGSTVSIKHNSDGNR